MNSVAQNTRALLLIEQSELTHFSGEAISMGGKHVQFQVFAQPASPTPHKHYQYYCPGIDVWIKTQPLAFLLLYIPLSDKL
jgi:hypothetical protein